MDYFNELLESYSLLKKRTFKLTYLTEQEEEQVNAQAVASAQSLVMNPEGVSTDVGSDQGAFKSQKKKTDATEVPYAYRNDKGEVIVQWTGFGRNTRVTVPNGNFDEMPEPQKGQLIGYFSDGQAANAAGEEPDSPEAFAQAELAGTKYDLGELKQSLHNIYLTYVKFCETTLTNKYKDKKDTVELPLGEKQDIERKCYRSAFSKVYESKRGGLSGLLSATKIQQQFVDPQKEGGDPELEITLTEEASPGLVIDALQTIELLFDYANNPEKYADDDEICERFADKIATTKELVSDNGNKIGKGGAKRVIFYGATKEEGIVVPAQSQEYKTAMESAEKRCKSDYEDGLFSDIDLRDVDGAALNAKKGTLHERLSSLMVDLYNLKGTGTKQQKQAVLKSFLAALEKAGKVATYLQEAIIQDGAKRTASLDESLANDLGLQEFALFKDEDKTELKNFLLDYYRGMEAFLEKVKPAAYIHNGLASTTGGRADQFIVFRDADHANTASKNINTKTYAVDAEEFINNSENPEKTRQQLTDAGVKPNEEGEIHVMEMGQKLYAKAKTAKVGEIGTTKRLMQLMLGKLTKEEREADKHLDNDFMDEVDRRFPLTGAAKTAIEDLDSDLKTISDYINNDTTWTDEKGRQKKLVSQANVIVKQMLGKLSYDVLSDSELGKLLRGWKGTNTEKQKLATELQRLRMAKTMDALSKTKGGRTAICRMGFICGGNARDLVQSIFIEDGRKHYAVRQNEVFDKFEKAIEDDTLKVTAKGFTVTIDDGNGFVGSIKTTGDWNESKLSRNVRTEFDIAKSTIEIDNVGPGGKGGPDGVADNLQAHTLHKYMEGQMKLLETLLN